MAAPYEVANTLQGKYRDIPVRIDMFDLPYPNKHEDPFPVLDKYNDEIDTGFKRVLFSAFTYFILNNIFLNLNNFIE